ncbi:MAG: PBP1A family penicillin-binding protein [Candidatus Moraniibacteriota bacterium]|nr:MAG: PBP1A family penicillin-binding protein [Candidatus Moranbacteria bacterium]
MNYIFTKKYLPERKNSVIKKSSFESSSSKNGKLAPENNSQKEKKGFKISWKKFFTILGILFGLGSIFLIGMFFYFSKDLPSPGQVNDRVIPESTKIYDRTGQHLLYEIHGEQKRTLIPFSDIPSSVKYATIVLEDQDFYYHRGIKIDSILRVALNNIIKMNIERGASTITQQLIKNSLLTSEKTYTRKIKEVILSLRVEQKFSKDEILSMYLNEIPYGSNAYGIESASQTFFNKNAKDLTLDESALLASLPQAPSTLSPFGSRTEKLIARQQLALSKMLEKGYISQEEYENSKNINTLEKIKPQLHNIFAPHFVMYVKEYLEEKYGVEMLEQGGLSVITTLDWEKQQLAEKVVREGAEKNKTSWNAENAALVAIDPKNSQIVAMVGSKDFFSEDIDGQVNVALRDRQPGSSIKPFVYLTAFTKGYTPETILFDVETQFDNEKEGGYSPQNYNGTFSGPVPMKEALAQSLNIPAVKTLYLAGTKESINLSKSLGITSLNNPSRYGLSLVLGGGEVKLLDHTHAYATLASGGIRREKTSILRVVTKDNKILEEFTSSQGVRVVEEEYVAMLDHVLSTNAYRSPVFGEKNFLRFDNYQVAAKTGTTNEFRDAWTMGYTPTLSVGVWVGNNDNRSMKIGADGSVIAAPIWRSFLEEVLKNTNKESFPEYDKEKFKREKDILNGELSIKENVKVCKIPGKKDKYCLANKYCTDNNDEEKKDFANAHTILYFVDIKDPLGEKPKNPESDPQYKNWEKAVQKYYKDEDYIFDEAPEDECKKDDFSEYKPKISLSIPNQITQRSLVISTDVDSPYDIDSIEYIVDGNVIEKTSSKSISYSIPEDKNGSTLSIKVKLQDEVGNTAEDEKKIEVSF